MSKSRLRKQLRQYQAGLPDLRAVAFTTDGMSPEQALMAENPPPPPPPDPADLVEPARDTKHPEHKAMLPPLYGEEANLAMGHALGVPVSTMQIRWMQAHKAGRYDECAALRQQMSNAAMATLHQWA